MSLDWSPDWRAKYFGRSPRRLPPGYRSYARAAWDDERQRAERQEQDEIVAMCQHVRALREADVIDRWEPLVRQFGSAAVETIVKRTNPAFALPEALRGIPPGEFQDDRRTEVYATGSIRHET